MNLKCIDRERVVDLHAAARRLRQRILRYRASHDGSKARF